MIKNIVFDLGNVIIRWDPKYIASQYTSDEVKQNKLIANLFGSSYWQSFDDGSLTREQVISNVQQTLPEEYHAMVYDMVHHWHKYAPPINGMEELVRALKERGYQIYLLSNTNVHFDEYKDTVPALQHFDGYYISAQTNLMKPHIEIYQDFLQTFSLIAEECIFLDDISDNIVGASEAGMDGYHFDGDMDKLRSHLNELQIL
jgi:putative hydrolase of the HAD superfamily